MENIKKFEPEDDFGNTEYKRNLINLDYDTINKRMTQMEFRLGEDIYSGEAIYKIGVADDGILLGLNLQEYDESVSNLEKIGKNINCSVTLIYKYINKNNLYIGEFLIRKNHNKFIDLKLCVGGNVDAGKSTLVSTLSKNILDNGRGSARVSVFNFKHEIDTGRTSSIGHQILGFDQNGNMIDPVNKTWKDITTKSKKLISFYDLCGHQKYLKTSIYGLISLNPDYCIIVIGANMGITHMTMNHINLAINLDIPFIIVVTKIDITPVDILNENLRKINNMLRNKICKIPYNIKNYSDILNVVKNIKTNSIVPIIQVSNVNNNNLEILRSLLNLLPLINNYSKLIDSQIELLIDKTYMVPGHTVVISGLLRSGTININDSLLLGPFLDSSFRKVKVRTIHLNYLDVKKASAGSYICVSLKNIIRKDIKNGMVLITDDNTIKKSIRRFTAEISILHSPTTINVGYQPIAHIRNIRQAVQILAITKKNVSDNITNFNNNILETSSNDNVLRTGDKAIVLFEFLFKPEFLITPCKIIFREGLIKAVGNIIELN
jgi:GTPase